MDATVLLAAAEFTGKLGSPRRERPVLGAPDAGAVARRAHPAGVLRHRLPRDGPVRRGAVPAHRRPDLQGARQALVEGRCSRCSRSAWSPARSCPSSSGCCGRSSWPPSATCSGSAFALEGFSFFIEAIFIAIYVYGWDRLPPRTHFLTGIPIAIAGVTGSLFVHRGQRLDEPPRRLHVVERAGGRRRSRGRRCSATYFWHEFVAHVPRRLHGRRLPRRRRLRLGAGCAAGATATTARRWSSR